MGGANSRILENPRSRRRRVKAKVHPANRDR